VLTTLPPAYTVAATAGTRLLEEDRDLWEWQRPEGRVTRTHKPHTARHGPNGAIPTDALYRPPDAPC